LILIATQKNKMMNTQKGALCSGRRGFLCVGWIDDTSECESIKVYSDAFDNVGTFLFFCSSDCCLDILRDFMYCSVCKRHIGHNHALRFCPICDKCDFERRIGNSMASISEYVPDWALARAGYHSLQAEKIANTIYVSILFRGFGFDTVFARANPVHAIDAALLLLAATRFDKGSRFGKGMPMDVARLIARRVFDNRFAREWLELDLFLYIPT
jgi:hypothetical protein